VGNYATRRVGDETVVVPIRSSAADLDSVYTLNAVGAAIWAQLEAARTGDEIAGRVAEEFEVDSDVAQADVARFLESLLAAGMIEEVAR
jgi:Coenzyme PQQ synthesis protein D (PqqD)